MELFESLPCPNFCHLQGGMGFWHTSSHLLVAQQVSLKSRRKTLYFFFLPFASAAFLRVSSSEAFPALTVLVRGDSAQRSASVQHVRLSCFFWPAGQHLEWSDVSEQRSWLCFKGLRSVSDRKVQVPCHCYVSRLSFKWRKCTQASDFSFSLHCITFWNSLTWECCDLIWILDAEKFSFLHVGLAGRQSQVVTENAVRSKITCCTYKLW